MTPWFRMKAASTLPSEAPPKAQTECCYTWAIWGPDGGSETQGQIISVQSPGKCAATFRKISLECNYILENGLALYREGLGFWENSFVENTWQLPQPQCWLPMVLVYSFCIFCMCHLPTVAAFLRSRTTFHASLYYSVNKHFWMIILMMRARFSKVRNTSIPVIKFEIKLVWQEIMTSGTW